MKRTFDKNLLVAAWGLPHNIDKEGEIIEDTIVETSRWSEIHSLIFKAPDDGKFYEVSYSQGLTEYQDESPWEYDSEVQGTEVEPREVTVVKYLPVEG